MGRIAQCVKDVIAIAKRSQDFGRAQQRIERLFAESKAAHRGSAAVAQRVKDQIEQRTAMCLSPPSTASIRCSTGWIAIIWGGPGVRCMCEQGRTVSLLFDRDLSPAPSVSTHWGAPSTA